MVNFLYCETTEFNAGLRGLVISAISNGVLRFPYYCSNASYGFIFFYRGNLFLSLFGYRFILWIFPWVGVYFVYGPKVSIIVWSFTGVLWLDRIMVSSDHLFGYDWVSKGCNIRGPTFNSTSREGVRKGRVTSGTNPPTNISKFPRTIREFLAVSIRYRGVFPIFLRVVSILGEIRVTRVRRFFWDNF